MRLAILTTWLGAMELALGLSWNATVNVVWAQDLKPNMLVIWGERHWKLKDQPHRQRHDGLPDAHIDRIAGVGLFPSPTTDAQQRCTAGRAAFIGGNVPVRVEHDEGRDCPAPRRAGR